MKKTSHSPKAGKAAPETEPLKSICSWRNPPRSKPFPTSPTILAENQASAVVGREEEASSSGHRIEPIINDEEGNAEKLIEEGLHGYVRASPNHQLPGE